MDKSLTRMINEWDNHKGELVIIYDKITRFVGVGEDLLDYFYIGWDGKNISYHCALDILIPLKGVLPDKDYKTLLIQTYGHWDQMVKRNPTAEMDEEKFMELIKTDLTQWKDHIYHTEFFFEIR